MKTSSFLSSADPEIESIIHKAAAMFQKQPLPTIQSCPRCGEVGHDASVCPNQVPSFDSMDQFIEERISMSIQLAPKEWKEDEFGLYLPSTADSSNDTKCWTDGEFCFNCGEFGHSKKDCQKPTSSEISRIFGDSLEQKGNRAIFLKSQYIDRVRRLCEQPNKEKKDISMKQSKSVDSLWT